jgi:hypothetical protein
MHFQILVVVLAFLSLLAQSSPVSWPWRWGRDNEAPSVGTPLESPIRADDLNSAGSFKELIENSVNFREITQVILPRIEDWFVPIPLHPRFSTITNSSSIFEKLASYVVESEREISPIGAFISSSNDSVTTIKIETPALEAEVKLKLCFRASEHDFLASEFHRLCDGKGATITLVKDSTDKMAAAYNGVSWVSGRPYSVAIPNPQGFLASIIEGPEEGGGYVFKKYAAIASTLALSYSGFGPCFEVDFRVSEYEVFIILI